MATNYDLLATASTVQVLSPTLVQPVVDCTLKSKPTGVVFDYWVDKAVWDGGTAPPLLEQVAFNVEHIISATPAISGVGSQHLDANGLLAQSVTFTVAATAPGGTPDALTIEVEVPIGDLDQESFGGQNFGLTAAIDLIDAAYQQLLAAAAG